MDKKLILFGKHIALLRKQKNYTQEQLADLAHVHRNYISKVERGQQNLTMKKMLCCHYSLMI